MDNNSPSMLEKIKAWLMSQKKDEKKESPWSKMGGDDQYTRIDKSMKRAFGTPGDMEASQIPARVNGGY